MYRKLASAILVAGALNAKYAFALGLGGMTMHSALNQPLDAEISLSSIGNLDKSQISIGLASQEEFIKAGVDRSFFLSNIKFEIVLDGHGGGVVKLRSSNRLNEPYLDVLLEAKWPTGRVLRSYTALIDLPVYTENKTADLDMAEVSASTPATELGFQPAATSTFDRGVTSSSTVNKAKAAAPVKAKPAPSKPVVKASTQRAIVNTQEGYQVQRGETLSQVALKLKATDDVTLNQTMLAIQRLNPQAFIKNNINLMKAGVVLRVPTEADIRQVTATAARGEVAEQNREWRGRQVDATDIKPSKSVVMPDKDEGHLSLTSAGAGMANGHDNVKKVDSQAISAKGSVAGDASAKAEALKSEAKDIKKMIEVKDAELAKLQKNLATKKADETKPALAEVDTAKQSAPADAAKTDNKAEEVKAPSAETTSQESVTKTEEVNVEKKAVEPKLEVAEVTEESWLEKIKNNPLYIGIPGFLLIFGVVAVLFRRKAQADRMSMEENDFDNFDFDHDSEVEEYESESVDVEDLHTADTDVESEDDYADAIDDEDDATAQTADPIGEADIYVAYGRFDQAIELLNKSLKVAPGNIEIRKKLLEIYVESKNKQGFQEQYLALRDAKSTAAVVFAKELLSSAGGVSDWLDDLPEEEVEDVVVAQIEEEIVEEDEVINLDDLDDLTNDIEPTQEPEPSVDIIDTDFDLDLGLDVADVNLSEEVETTLDDLSSDFNLDELSSDIDVDLGSVASEEFELANDTLLDLSNEFDSVDVETSSEESLDDDLDFSDMDFSLASTKTAVLEEEFESSNELSFELSEELSDDSFGIVEADVEIETPLSFDLDIESDELATDDVASFDEMDLSESFDLDTLDVAASDESIELIEPVNVVDSTNVTAEAFEPVAIVDMQINANEPHVSASFSALESEDLEFLTDGDEVSTKLDLAQAYVDLGDVDGAREILLEVLKEGKEEQKAEAASLLDSLD